MSLNEVQVAVEDGTLPTETLLPGGSAVDGHATPSDPDRDGDRKDGWCRELNFFRAMLTFFTGLMLIDQYLDGAVLAKLDGKGFEILAGVMAASIVVPQVLVWIFLRANSMTDYVSLLRILAFPTISAITLAGIWQSGASCPKNVKSLLIFMICISLEPFALFVKDWRAGKRSSEAVWASLAEGQIEAPSSSVLTLYPAMLLSAVTDEGMNFLFFASSAWSMVSITKCCVELHFYGQKPITSDMVRVAVRDKFPCVVSQLLAYAIFAFLTRPFPGSEDDLQAHSSCYAVFAVLLQELSLNFAMLRAISPKMRKSVAAFLATCMVVAGPPGFLRALDAARPAHGLQHFVGVILMATWAWLTATPEHWQTLLTHYLPYLAALVVTTLWAFVASQWTSSERLSHAQQTYEATQRLDEAILAGDRLMAGLLLDVESIDAEPGYIGGGALTQHAFIPTGKGEGGEKWMGIAALGGRLYCCPFNAEEVLVIEPGASIEETRLSFIPTGKGEGANKWTGIAALGGRLYCCPGGAEEVLIIEPGASIEETRVSFIPTGKGEGGGKWIGIAALGGRLYCCPSNAEEVLVIEPGASIEETRLSFIPTGKGGFDGKWSGIAALGGLLYCCPFEAEEVLIIEPGASIEETRLSFIPTGKGEGDAKWMGIAALGGRLYCCPFEAEDVLVVEPAASIEEIRITSIPAGKGKSEAKWMGIVAFDGLLYCCPFCAEEVLFIDPKRSRVGFIKGSGGEEAKWSGIAVHEPSGMLYCAPACSEAVLRIDPASRLELLRKLGLGEAMPAESFSSQ